MAGVGLWWLILFARRSVAQQFAGGEMAAPATVAPHTGGLGPATLGAPAAKAPQVLAADKLPVVVMVIAICFLVVPVVVLPSDLANFYRHFPSVFFGHIFLGSVAFKVHSAGSVIWALMGVGLLFRRRWALFGAVALCGASEASAVVGSLTPHLAHQMREAMSGVLPGATGRELPPSYYVFSWRFALVFGAVLRAMALWFLWTRRGAFAKRTSSGAGETSSAG